MITMISSVTYPPPLRRNLLCVCVFFNESTYFGVCMDAIGVVCLGVVLSSVTWKMGFPLMLEEHDSFFSSLKANA